jgi:3-oxoacyl-(acyl-carrier-protein) synthase
MERSLDTAIRGRLACIAGCGAVSALGLGLEPLAEALRTNASGLRPSASQAGRGYQSIVGGWVPEELIEQLRTEDPSHADARAFLLTQSALIQAQTSVAARVQAVAPSRRGLVLSTTKADLAALERWVAREPCSPAAQRHIHPALLAADLAAAHEVNGPVQTVSAACISGLSAIRQGAALLRRGTADLVFVAGVDLVSHLVLAGFTSVKALDPEGCRPFDRDRTGLSLGEGAGALVLFRCADVDAPAPVILGVGTSNDANHLTGPSRDGSGLGLAMERALERANARPDSIDYLHAHGTGTPYNDQMESLAMRLVFGERPPPFSSSKGMLGHTLAAAGILETILCWMALRAQILPGTPRLRARDPVAPESIVDRPRPASRLRRILKVNCGFGGTNSALVLEGGGA